ncbi:WXG100 family type VII secretion target [Streptomyces anthocyanicus]|uniref:WXG100 family type VII secretion target n=1 Tax=Streptomyces anthocyanicus TaxID=68174 RepID=UPI002F90AF68|nr:WXG100 family type VII secretion target [Streptomyces anthocyanicus]
MSTFDDRPIFVGTDLQDADLRINELAGTIEHELEVLRRRLQPMIETWIAKSSSDYQALKANWDTAAVGLFGDETTGGVLGSIAAMMRVNWNNYSEAEEANRKTWASS